MNPAGRSLRISLIVPVWHDRESLAELLRTLVRLERLHEIIVVDAAGDPLTAELVSASGGIYLRAAQPNRGAQMNLGAARASGDVFIFHHADTLLDAAHLAALEVALRDPAIGGGAFYRKFDGRHPRLLCLERVARFFTRRGGTLFGDQSVFVRREVFAALGGFAAIPLMEDMEFSRRLRRSGPVAVLDPPVESSARRHLRGGAWRTSLQNGLFIVLYRCGCPPHRLHRWYYHARPSGPNEPMPGESALAPQPLEELSRG